MRVNIFKTDAQIELLLLISVRGKITERTQNLYVFGFKPVTGYLKSLGLIECKMLVNDNHRAETEVRLTDKGKRIVELIKIWEAI